MNKRAGWLVVVLAAGLGLTLALLGFTQSAQADLWAGEMDEGRAIASQASTCQAQIDGEPTIYGTVQDAVDMLWPLTCLKGFDDAEREGK